MVVKFKTLLFYSSLIALMTLVYSLSFWIETRLKIILIDSGVNMSKELEPYICSSGHRNFINEHETPFKDSSGHGTMMAQVMARTLNPNKTCIVIYKSYKEVTSEYYYQALIESTKYEDAIIAIALEDVGYYVDEIKLFKLISARNKVFIAAGNSGKNLDFNCDVYPACLASKINSSNFIVVGDDRYIFNHAGPVSVAFPSSAIVGDFSFNGTSVSTAYAVGYFAKSQQ